MVLFSHKPVLSNCLFSEGMRELSSVIGSVNGCKCKRDSLEDDLNCSPEVTPPQNLNLSSIRMGSERSNQANEALA